MRGNEPSRGEIWWLNLEPVMGSEADKTRPVVVVSSPVFDPFIRTRLIVPLTTWRPHFEARSNLVRVDSTEINGLDHDSAANFLQIRSVALERFVELIGYLEADLLEEMVAGIAIAVDYNV